MATVNDWATIVASSLDWEQAHATLQDTHAGALHLHAGTRV